MRPVATACLALLIALPWLTSGCPRPPEPPPPPPPSSDTHAEATPPEEVPSPPTGEPERLDNPDTGDGLGIQASSVDPVCGMTVELTGAVTYTWGDTSYLFCSQHCADEFAKNPKQYLRKEGDAGQ